MSPFRRTVRQALTVARRDFVATVFAPTFLIFLLSPLLMGSFGAIGGYGAASAVDARPSSTEMLALVAPDQVAAMRAADAQLRQLYATRRAPAALATRVPDSNPQAAARHALDGGDSTTAVLFGDLRHPTVLYGGDNERDAHFLAALAEQTLRTQASGTAPLSQATITEYERPSASESESGHRQAAMAAVFGVFFLTFLLAGQVIAGVTEERNNKVIEVLAAAVPLEAVFFGKLIGMFGTAIVFVAFWGTLVLNITRLLPPSAAEAIANISPAVGGPMFVLLFCVYFSLSYLLLGGVFLGMGAQASNPRALQMLSLPLTIVQIATFSFAFSSIGAPDSWKAWVAMLFPLSSPFTMAGRAAAYPELWPHLLAIAWQLLWVVIVVTVGARAFKRGVLQSGNSPLGLKGLFRRG